MMWVLRGAVRVWRDEPFPELEKKDLAAYRFCAVPVDERPRPTCGRVGQGRDAHTQHGEPACALCVTAERLYGSHRRGVIPETARRFKREELAS